MANRTPLSRRDSLKTIAASGALLGGGALGVSAVIEDDETRETETGGDGDDDDDESDEIDPSAIQLAVECVDEDHDSATFRIDNENEESVTLMAEETHGDAGSFDGDHEEEIERINEIIETTNESLENVDDIETIDDIDGNTADRLQDEIFTQVVEEINAQSQEILGEDIADDVDTPEEARAEADEIEEEYGNAAEEAVDGLNNSADNVEEIHELIDGLEASGDDSGDTDNGDADSDDDGDDDHEEEIDRINEIIETTNESLENVDDIETIDEIDGNTADRLQDEIFTQVVEEINTQSQEILGEDIADDVNTPEEARQEADEIEEEYGNAAEEAVDGLNNSADNIEEIHELTDGVDDTGGDRLTVDANSSTEFTADLEPEETTTMALYLDDDNVAEKTVDPDEVEAYC